MRYGHSHFAILGIKPIDSCEAGYAEFMSKRLRSRLAIADGKCIGKFSNGYGINLEQ